MTIVTVARHGSVSFQLFATESRNATRGSGLQFLPMLSTFSPPALLLLNVAAQGQT
jgi:hypothetical protein